jgi:hypothetical protein
MGMIPQRYLCHRARTARAALSTCGGKGETGVGVAVGLAISTEIGVTVGVGERGRVAVGTGVSAATAEESAAGPTRKKIRTQMKTSSRSGYLGFIGIPF